MSGSVRGAPGYGRPYRDTKFAPGGCNMIEKSDPFKIGKYFYFYYNAGSGRIRKSTRQTEKRAANRWIARFLTDLEKGLTDKTLAEYCAPYYVWGSCPLIQSRLDENKSIGMAHVKAQRKRLEEYILKDRIARIPVSSLKRSHILDFRTRMRTITTANNTNKIVGVLKAILKHAYHREDIDRDPTAGIGNIKVTSREKGIFTPEELRELLDPEKKHFTYEKQRVAYSIMAKTGMRRAELLALQWRDIDWAAGVIRVIRSFKGDNLLGSPKWGKTRIIPLNIRPGLREELEEWAMKLPPQSEDHVISGTHHRYVALATFDRWLQGALKSMRIDQKARNLSAHSLRHGLVTSLKEEGVPQEVIQRVIGHSEAKVTEGYTHLSDTYLASFFDS